MYNIETLITRIEENFMTHKITVLNFSPLILDTIIDFLENKIELQQQLEADVKFGGINTEIKQQVIEELIDRLNNLIPNIIIATHE